MGESHIYFHKQCAIKVVAGGREGVIANDILKKRKVIEFQSS